MKGPVNISDLNETFIELGHEIDSVEAKLDEALVDCSNRGESLLFLQKRRDAIINDIRKRNSVVQKYTADLLEVSHKFDIQHQQFTQQNQAFFAQYTTEKPKLELRYERLSTEMHSIFQKMKLYAKQIREIKIKMAHNLTDLEGTQVQSKKSLEIIHGQPHFANNEAAQEIQFLTKELPLIKQKIAHTEVQIEKHNLCLSQIRNTDNWRVIIKAKHQDVKNLQERLNQTRVAQADIKQKYRQSLTHNSFLINELNGTLRLADNFREDADINRRCSSSFSIGVQHISVAEARRENDLLQEQMHRLEAELNELDQEYDQIEELPIVPSPVIEKQEGTFQGLLQLKAKIREETEISAQLRHQLLQPQTDFDTVRLHRKQLQDVDSALLELRECQQRVKELRIEVEKSYWEKNVFDAEILRFETMVSSQSNLLPNSPSTTILNHEKLAEKVKRLELRVKTKQTTISHRPGGIFTIFKQEKEKWETDPNSFALLTQWNSYLDTLI